MVRKDRHSRQFIAAVFQHLDPRRDFDIKFKGDKYILEILGWTEYAAEKPRPAPGKEGK